MKKHESYANILTWLVLLKVVTLLLSRSSKDLREVLSQGCLSVDEKTEVQRGALF